MGNDNFCCDSKNQLENISGLNPTITRGTLQNKSKFPTMNQKTK